MTLVVPLGGGASIPSRPKVIVCWKQSLEKFQPLCTANLLYAKAQKFVPGCEIITALAPIARQLSGRQPATASRPLLAEIAPSKPRASPQWAGRIYNEWSHKNDVQPERGEAMPRVQA